MRIAIVPLLTLSTSLACTSLCRAAAPQLPPDITVAADGSGNFKTVQQALDSIPADNKDRIVILVKNGVYNERLRIVPSFITLRGESRKDTRIEFNPAAAGGRGRGRGAAAPAGAPPATRGAARGGGGGGGGGGGSVVNLVGSDFILDNITLLNSGGDPEPHAVTVSSSTADRVVFLDSDVLSEGADTVSLWRNDGHYYHARCNFRGAVDSVCPHGWCYITDSTFFETRRTAVVWHDGKGDPNKKFVLRNCKFEGFDGYHLARHHHDGEFFFLDCAFTSGMIDRAPYRVIYPLDGGPPSEADILNNKQHDPTNIWGERNYFYHCHRDGGDYAWLKDNLAAFSPSLRPEQITPAWTFDNAWDPEDRSAPRITAVEPRGQSLAVSFSEAVSVKGKPVLLGQASEASYLSGSGTDTLLFNPVRQSPGRMDKIDLRGGLIVATKATALPRPAELTLPH
jgi:pectinesterase